MPELNLKQITDKLNAEFAGEGRKLVFWYDDQAEFAEDIESLELVNAKLLRIAEDKQFYAKYFLERLDREGNYLVYAPFPNPPEGTITWKMRCCTPSVSLPIGHPCCWSISASIQFIQT